MAKKRLTRYWTKNEKEVMKKLGLNPVPGSGSGDVHKEDGENEFVLCQLKSTEANSIRINKLDIEKLLYNSEVVNKIPVFAIQFMGGPLLLATVPEELSYISKYLNEGLFERNTTSVVKDIIDNNKDTKIDSEIIQASNKSIEELIKDANNKLYTLNESEANEEIILPALQKRKERKIKEKERFKWQKF